MRHGTIRSLTIPATALLAAACASYVAKPLDPDKLEAEFRARSLSDPGLRAYLGKHSPTSGTLPPPAWDLDALTGVALYYHPDLDVARARVAVAEAAVRTAGGRPNPTLRLDPGRSANPPAGVSPWILGAALDIPVETAGKRGYRIAQAERLTDAARIELAETAWKVRGRVRGALVEHLLALREADLRRAEAEIRAEAARLIERGVAAGAASRPEFDEARSELAAETLALRAADGRVLESRLELAASLGLPPEALDGVRFARPELDSPPGADRLPAPEVRRAALLNRLDLRRLLAEYAAAEAALQGEVAKQYPDVSLGPGYQWDQGENKFNLGLSVALPVFNRNEGPIAEAEARRRETAERFLALQARAIGEIDQALARYRSALRELAEAEGLQALLESRERVSRRAVELGRDNRLTLAGVQAQGAAAARSRLEARRKAQQALGALEDSMQRPVALDEAVPDFPPASPREPSRKEEER